jgi:FAD/FMN-containing dehydrogenase
VLFVPSDDVLLSASRGLEGFAVTVAFETMKDSELPPRMAALRDLSRICLSVGGRVHVGKTVCADVDVLRAMYGDALEAFRMLKDVVDPKRVLRNEFLERVFPELLVRS